MHQVSQQLSIFRGTFVSGLPILWISSLNGGNKKRFVTCRSSSADNASIVARDLIEHAETAPYFLLMCNEVGGGGGRVSEAAGREGHVVYLASMSLEMERRLVPEAGDT